MIHGRHRGWTFVAGVSASLLIGAASADGGGAGGAAPKPGPEGLFERFDANGDGILARDEVPERVWEKVAAADADGSGGVTLAELQAAHRAQPGAPGRDPQAMFTELDRNQDGQVTQDEAPGPVWEKLSKADADGDGGVTLDEFRAARPQPPAGGGAGGPDPAEMMRRLDANQDGKLTQDEVPAELWAKVSKADADGDGAVTADELRAARPARPEPADVFARLDANGDGQIAQDEVPAEKWQWLGRADADGNGSVSRDEFLAAHAGAPGGPAAGGDFFDRLDANRDGGLSQDEVPAEKWEWLSRADANGDGKVTREELAANKPAK